MEDSLAVVLPKTGNHKKRLNNGGDLGAGGWGNGDTLFTGVGALSAKLICFFFPVGRVNKWALSVVQ